MIFPAEMPEEVAAVAAAAAAGFDSTPDSKAVVSAGASVGSAGLSGVTETIVPAYWESAIPLSPSGTA